jgi:hypothetical protein
VAEEEKSPIFKSSEGAFDRAKMTSDISSGNPGAVTSETGDKARSADKVIQEAKNYYNKKYNDEIKKLDPEYSPAKVEYVYSYSNIGSDFKFFKNTIDKGGELDGVKDVTPRAIESANNLVRNANVIKTGAPAKVINKIGIGNIKDMDSYDAVKSQFDEKSKGEGKSFEDLLSAFTKISSYFDEPITDPKQVKVLYTPENNAIIAALSKILVDEGIKSENVAKSAGLFEDYLKKLTEGKEGSIEGAKTTPAAAEKKEDAKTETGPQKIEATKEEKPKLTEAPKAAEKPVTSEASKSAEKPAEKPANTEAVKSPEKLATTETGKVSASEGAKPIESNTTPGAEAKPVEAKSTAQESKTELTSKEEPKNSPEAVGQGNQGAADFFSSIFGGGGGKKEETVESAAAGKSPEAKTEVTKVASKTEAKATSMESAKGPVLSTSKTAIEKKSVANETNKASTSIKETSPQKLASASPITETQKSKTEEAPKNAESTKPEEAAASGAENPEATTGAAEEKKEETSKDSTASAGGDDLSKKMDLVASLLAQMNETLQGPLLVTGFSKKFE